MTINAYGYKLQVFNDAKNKWENVFYGTHEEVLQESLSYTRFKIMEVK